MDDLISRQAAIDALDAICDRECEYPKKQRAVMCAACHLGSAFDAIDELPPAERHGRWEYTKELYRDPNGNHLFYGKICSECNSVSPYDSPYCMNCGANMQQGVTLVGAKMDEVSE